MTLITNRRRQLFEMAELQRSQSDQGTHPPSAESGSHRSRASSVISTGTKFSISTIPPGHLYIDGILEESNSRSTATRPASLHSVRSMAPSLPPYEGHQPMDAMLPLGTSHRHPYNIQTHTGRDVSSASSDPEQPLTPSDPVNALSMHYGRVVRTIDENHASQLARIRQDHEQELAATRNAIDEAYRKEFKAKNREIERVHEQAALEIEQVRREAAADVAAIQEEIEITSSNHDETVRRIQRENTDHLILLHEEHHAAIEKAKHAVEDLWEGRWHDRTKVAAEEAKRAADEAVRLDAERDAEWLRVIRSMHPELVDEIKTAMKIL